eukprot:scaffold1086_cov66-Cylindrotheca_fusiformis.AAC.1
MAKHVTRSIFSKQPHKVHSATKKPRDEAKKSRCSSPNIIGAAAPSPSPSCSSISSEEERLLTQSPKSLQDGLEWELVEEANNDRKSVRFGNCHIRHYNQVLGDNPSVSAGCPVQLGWKILDEKTLSVDQMEDSKAHRPAKSMEDMVLSARRRRTILKDLTDTEIQVQWRMMTREARRKNSRVREGMRQFREIGAYYAGF